MEVDFDVVVVGASLAGAATALVLGRRGVKVALIDRVAFPRRKPCGEGLSAYGVSLLEALGVRERILAMPHVVFSGYRTTAGGVTRTIRAPHEHNVAIQRELFDHALLQCAVEQSSVTPILSSTITEVVPNAVILGKGQIRAQRIVVACGGNSRLLHGIGCRAYRSGPCRSGVTVTYRGRFGVPPTTVRILLRRKFQLLGTPLAGGRLNLSLLTRADSKLNPRDLISDPELIEAMFQEFDFSGELELEPQGRANIGNVRRSCEMPSIILAGDAREEFDPIGGMGMSHALSSGMEAAESILAQLDGSTEPATSFHESPTFTPGTRAMRCLTRLSYGALSGAARFPLLLSLAASDIGNVLIKTCAKDLL